MKWAKFLVFKLSHFVAVRVEKIGRFTCGCAALFVVSCLRLKMTANLGQWLTTSPRADWALPAAGGDVDLQLEEAPTFSWQFGGTCHSENLT